MNSAPRRLATFFLLIGLLNACASTGSPESLHRPGFFVYSLPSASLLIADTPAAPPRQVIALPPPADCALHAIHPAPRGSWIAIEWDCPSGLRVQLLDTASRATRFALRDPTLDNRLLAWHPAGRALYLKVGTLSNPQTVRLEVDTGQATDLNLPGFLYDLAPSPDGARLLYSLSNGIGFGSETWLGAENAQNASQLLVEPASILALAQFSPDGRQIAYIKMPDSTAQYPPGELWIMASDGSQAHFVAQADAGRGFGPAWSPRGDQIAFVSRRNPAANQSQGTQGLDDPAEAASLALSLYTLADASLRVWPAALLKPPAWSPEGTLLVFTALENDTMTVWQLEIATQRAEKLYTAACCAGWLR